MTYRKIAELAGVSLSTVSKAMSGSPEISRATAERIRKIAEEHHVVGHRYHKNTADLRVAIVAPEIISVYYSQTITDYVRELEEKNIDAAVYVADFDAEKAIRCIERIVLGGEFDGVIAISCYYPKKSPIPIISDISPKYFDLHLGGDLVCSDTRSGMLAAMTYLVELGHRDIGFISEKNTSAKLAVFKENAARLGLSVPPRYLFVSNKRFQDIGYEAAEHFLHIRRRPTALIAAYDEAAMGAIHAFRAHGVDVPGDISVIGINDIPFAAYSNPPLTTIRTYRRENARMITELLLERIAEKTPSVPRQIMLSCDLIVRETTAPPKGK